MSDSAGPLMDLLATCTFGLEAVVARELEQLGYDAQPIATGRVLFKGDWRAVCEANIWLRAADRVLIRVATFPVAGGDAGFDLLFEGVKALPWERYIARTAAFPVAGRCVRSQLSSEPAVQRATKRAIVERLRVAFADRGVGAILPETGPTVQVEVSIVKDVATLTIDTSGVGLHKRGYREGTPGEAAMKETLAAGLLQLSVWRPARAGDAGKVRPLVDPFCGSGTIAIEAAMWARSIAPGLNRSFAAESWLAPQRTPSVSERDGGPKRLVDPALWAEVREEARAAIVPEHLSPTIHATDIDEHALAIARHNARRAGVDRDIHFAKRDALELASKLEYGVIITNPPYGIRLGDQREIERLYARLPASFRRLPTWTFHVFTGVLTLEQLFGQTASRRRKIYNSSIECCYFTFLGPKPAKPGHGEASTADDAHAAPEIADVSSDFEPDMEQSDASTDDAASALVPDDVREADRPAFTHESSDEPSPTHSSQAPVRAFGGLRERDTREAEEFGRCLANNLRHLRKYPSRGITCYRVYERDVPDVPLIVDRYDDWFHASEYEREHSRTPAQQADWFDLMRRTISTVAEVPIEQVVMKEKHRQRGLTQHEKLGDARRTMIVSEGGDSTHGALRFEVNLFDYVDTGLFLDHRLTRQMVRQDARGKRFLNLFCYTGSFTIYAAAGGASSTTSVDLSNTYLAWAKRNLELNALMAPHHRAVCDDVMAFLRNHPRQGSSSGVGEYDLVVVDPPTFSNSKSLQDDWEVGARHVELVELLAPLMVKGGVVYFSNNFRRFKFDEAGVLAAGFDVRDISSKTVPPEYRNRKVHRCWRLTRT